MGDKGKKDKGKREQQKKAQLNLKEKRKKEKRKKKRRNKCPVTLLVCHFLLRLKKEPLSKVCSLCAPE